MHTTPPETLNQSVIRSFQCCGIKSALNRCIGHSYEMSAYRPTFIGIAPLLIGVALLDCYVRARGATKVDDL